MENGNRDFVVSSLPDLIVDGCTSPEAWAEHRRGQLPLKDPDLGPYYIDRLNADPQNLERLLLAYPARLDAIVFDKGGLSKACEAILIRSHCRLANGVWLRQTLLSAAAGGPQGVPAKKQEVDHAGA